jgi:hypothetical protein
MQLFSVGNQRILVANVGVQMICNDQIVCEDDGMAKSRKGKLSSIQVDKHVATRFKEICDAMPMSPSMARVAAGLVNWFGEQSNIVRTAVVSGVPDGMEHQFADALEALAETLRRRGSGQNHTHGPGSSPLPPAPAAPGATKREPDPQQGRRHNTPPKVARTRGEGHSRG